MGIDGWYKIGILFGDVEKMRVEIDKATGAVGSIEDTGYLNAVRTTCTNKAS